MRRKAYPSDISNEEWEIIKPLLTVEPGIGRPREVDYREIINGIFYVLHEGCKWRALPHDLPPWQTVYNYFRYWQKLGIWQKIHTQLREQVRVRMNKSNSSTAGIIDSQSVKTEKKGSQRVAPVPPVVATGVGSLRLRCWQTGKGAQALYSSRYVRITTSSRRDGS